MMLAIHCNLSLCFFPANSLQYIYKISFIVQCYFIDNSMMQMRDGCDPVLDSEVVGSILTLFVYGHQE